jgi:DNA-binding transcriptional ArsR family regulator
MIQLSHVSPDEAVRSRAAAARYQRRVISAYPFVSTGQVLLGATLAVLLLSYGDVPVSPLVYAILIAGVGMPLAAERRRRIRARLGEPVDYLVFLAWCVLCASFAALAEAAIRGAGLPAPAVLTGIAAVLFFLATRSALNWTLRRLALRRVDGSAPRGHGPTVVGPPAPEAPLSTTARLSVAAVLAAVDEMEFTAVRDVLDGTDARLSKHVTALAAAGYVRERQRRGRTWLSLTEYGREAFDRHMAALEGIVSLSGLSVPAGR